MIPEEDRIGLEKRIADIIQNPASHYEWAKAKCGYLDFEVNVYNIIAVIRGKISSEIQYEINKRGLSPEQIRSYMQEIHNMLMDKDAELRKAIVDLENDCI